MADDDQVLRDAEAICDGNATDVATVKRLATVLRKLERHDVAARLLLTVARRALDDDRRPPWPEPSERPQLAAVLRDNQQFGYARRLFRRLHEADESDLEVRRQYALCVYKDAELPAARRLDRALDILRGAGGLRDSRDAETLGMAGAIYKRKWDVEARRGDLESARFCYSRGYEQTGHPQREYAGINAAFVLDQLASLDEHDALGDAVQAAALRSDAKRIREEIVETITARREKEQELDWDPATLAEAYFGLEDFEKAAEELRKVRAADPPPWHIETTAAQLAALARLRGLGADAQAGAARAAKFSESAAGQALHALLGDDEAALRRAYLGKVGLALSGGGFRASLFHVGVLAKLAEHDLLRRIEVLSCVSGGSILGAYYYLRLRERLQKIEDRKMDGDEYVELVRRVAVEFQDSVKRNLRVRLTEDVDDNWKMMARSDYSRTNRVSELLEELIYRKIGDGKRPWLMTDLLISPKGRERGFSPRYENWRRSAKVPILVLNATTLNTGHNWQFTASWMGEPPVVGDEQVDANPRLRRMYYSDAPNGYQEMKLADAVAASACVPALFPPLKLAGLFKTPGDLEDIDVELVDGGVHDNQGVASLLEQDCNVVLVSDASGQLGDLNEPPRNVLGVAGRSNSILMSRVRGAQYADLSMRLRSGSLRRLMIVHLKKGLTIRPLDWIGCPEVYNPEMDEIPASQDARRAAYEIDEGVQRGLAGLRTDLDTFSDDEAHALMAAGYKMTEYELSIGLPDFPKPDKELKPDGGWPFEAALNVVATPGALRILLKVGGERFGRGPRAWLEGRRGRPKRGLSRLVDRTGLPKVPGAARRVGSVAVVTPVRAVLSTPAALAGALATRGYLRVFGRRRKGN